MEAEKPNLLMNNDLETQAMDFDMQLDLLDTCPNHTEEISPKKQRKKKSTVWEHFTIETVGAGCTRARCKHCKLSLAHRTDSKVAGTSHLMRHIKQTCPVLHNQEKNKNKLSPYSAPSKAPKRQYKSNPGVDAVRCRHEIARMIIMHDYPLHIVEHPGFVAYVQKLQPRFDMVRFNTVQGDCVATYLREKHSIQKIIEGMPGRVCLTLDLWSSSRTIGYMFVSGQFIDSDWKMHRKLLNVIMEPYPNSDTAFSHSVASCLSDWSMDGKLFSVTINQNLSDASVDNLRALLSVKHPLVLGNCLARSLSSIVQDALASLEGIVRKVRDSVKYVKFVEEKFVELKQQLQVPSSKCLAIDDQTQWNTTYEMLLAASELKEVFSCLDYEDAPSIDDWKQIETLCTYVKPLFDTANLLTTATAPTLNMFFHEAWKIQLELTRAAASEDPFISSLTKFMQERFDEYWKSCCIILAIAVVMDPRFKMKLVEFSFSKLYGEEAAASYVKVVDDGIHELFLEYVALPVPLTLPAYAEEAHTSNGWLGLTDFDVYIMETRSQVLKSELDLYLEESLVPRVHEFDVIGWWKLNRIKYPTLSKMARDILSIPVSTVPAASVFDTVRKEMDSYRCSLRPETVEALICAKDWLLQSQNVQPMEVQI